MSDTTEKALSTFEKEMQSPEFKSEFEKEVKVEQLSEEEIKAKIAEIQEAEAKANELRVEAVRLLHPSKILNRKELEALMTVKEEDLTEADKSRIKLATLRLKKHNYTGTGYTVAEAKKAKAKRKAAKKSRKANRK